MKKVFALLLAAVMLSSVFAACGDIGHKTPSGEETTSQSETSSDEIVPEVPSDVDISGEFRILVAGNWEWNDFASDGEDKNVIDSAIYKRNQYIKDKYNVDITNDDIVKYSSAMGSGDGFKKIYTNYMAQEDIYGAAMIGTYDVANLAVGGYLHDMNDVKYLDLSKPYWDARANEDLSMNGKMFYTTGDISVADNRATYVMFFSKNMIKMYGMDNPYDLVKNNEWTIEKFGEMVKTVGTDNNQDGIYNKEDTFGLLTPTDTHLAIISAADERIATINEDGEIELTFYNERILNLYDKYLNIVTDPAHTYNYQGASGLDSTNEERIGMFNGNQALFYSHTMFYMDHLRDIESDFGIIPYPKYDAAQENYGNLVSAWHSQFVCVPETVVNLERTGIILEELAYYGEKVLTPAYYEKTLHGQYVRDEESSEMLDIIFDNLVYDVGIYYNIGTYKDKLATIVRTGSNYTTIYETYRSAAEAKIKSINEFFANNSAQ